MSKPTEIDRFYQDILADMPLKETVAIANLEEHDIPYSKIFLTQFQLMLYFFLIHGSLSTIKDAWKMDLDYSTLLKTRALNGKVFRFILYHI